MLKAELGYFKDHKLLIVVILAIALIPTIYAVTFLSSMWDPYGRTDQLPIAVVNDDHSASMSGKTLHVGDDLTKQLKDSNGFDFQFVSDHQAQQGLDSGKYYAIYKIPANFSKKTPPPYWRITPNRWNWTWWPAPERALSPAKCLRVAPLQYKPALTGRLLQPILRCWSVASPKWKVASSKRPLVAKKTQ